MSPGEAVFSVSPATLLGFPRPTTVQPRPLKAVPSVKMGVALNYSPTIGATADGKIMAFLPVGGGSTRARFQVSLPPSLLWHLAARA